MDDFRKRVVRETHKMEAELIIAGISKERFLDDAGIKAQTWSKWRRGNMKPKLETWELATDAFDWITQ